MSIRVAIVGVGNCASSLVQGIASYRRWSRELPKTGDRYPGLLHDMIGGYTPSDIEIVAAFDVDRNKVGQPLERAIFTPPNNTMVFNGRGHSSDIGDVVVSPGPLCDGIGPYTQHLITPTTIPADLESVAAVLKSRAVDILINYLPVGSQRATECYMDAALLARVGVVNCIPVFIASHPTWAERFTTRGVPIIGDDVKSQVGATIVHRTLVNLFKMRGVQVTKTYQLNVGGNTDFQNMLERSRLESKKISKTRAVTSQLDGELPVDDVHVGPSDYVPWLTDRKLAFIRVEGIGFGGAPMNVEVRMEVWDSPNSAGVVVDAIRYVQLARDRKISGPLKVPSAVLMKSPPEQMADEKATEVLLLWEVFADRHENP